MNLCDYGQILEAARQKLDVHGNRQLQVRGFSEAFAFVVGMAEDVHRAPCSGHSPRRRVWRKNEGFSVPSSRQQKTSRLSSLEFVGLK